MAAVLAAWRLTELLVYDAIFERVREWFGIAHDINGVSLGQMEDLGTLRNFVGALLSCVRCTSVWVGFGVAVLWGLLWSAAPLLVFICGLALSQSTIVANKYL